MPPQWWNCSAVLGGVSKHQRSSSSPEKISCLEVWGVFLHSSAELWDSPHATGHSHTNIPRNNPLLKLPEHSVKEAGETRCFEFAISFLSKGISYLLWLLKDSLKITKRGSWELPKDLPEELLGVDGGATAPVLPPRASPCPGRTGLETRCAVGIVLLPLHLVTQHLGSRNGAIRGLQDPGGSLDLRSQALHWGLIQLSVPQELGTSCCLPGVFWLIPRKMTRSY